MNTFARTVIAWQRRAGRHDLPWQGTRDPYRIWLSEIMLQQTQVGTVIPYYERFTTTFPTVAALAYTDLDAVMRLWAGLGYYTRARNLHRAAIDVVERFGGAFPREREAIESLPGVGRSTAAAIAAFAFGAREAILDGNVKRVLARHFAIEGFPGVREVEKTLWTRAESVLPRRGIEAYTQGLMDLGATLCTLIKPRCTDCPLNASCQAYAAGTPERYPSPRPKKAVPHRTTTMLVLRDGDEILLEHRPPTGIWGGLWSFPELADAKDAALVAATRFGCKVGKGRRLAIVRHGFTHFSLDIQPFVAPVAARSHQAAEPGAIWLSISEARRAAIPVPVKKILTLLGDSLFLPGQAALFEEAEEDL
ncbi:MAG: A/G-specific adenine glycosylase [Burkholderiales bacterium]